MAMRRDNLPIIYTLGADSRTIIAILHREMDSLGIGL